MTDKQKAALTQLLRGERDRFRCMERVPESYKGIGQVAVSLVRLGLVRRDGVVDYGRCRGERRMTVAAYALTRKGRVEARKLQKEHEREMRETIAEIDSTE